MKFDKLYKKVIDAQRAFEERHIPISLDFKIEDLRDALVESNDLIEKLKQKLDDAKATAYAECVDAGMRERRLKHALWLARAERAKEMCRRLLIQGFDPKWEKVEHKCLKKAEEYK